ncbi:uncharacterized protein MAM_00187 [Metarhizium album ARSEF 1941]|uniref:Uncharacterized protein n=1 Tax=Metarhizium album (strain ARSEF 1941) TaxID=1081103 RepID=A0A0B2X7C2_METAS|nr:uncharacterized protein MAM_00187 [Metarhizium album ARSEF 1941]KHO01186.1 hypothetical protein MAM_00187 [Metarhizium album ARSEF 1941]
MRAATPAEDSGMAESAFELISSIDVEDQDENYIESISESVGSLDCPRPDDVQSLAGTERTFDDESLADEEVEDPPRSTEREGATEFINDETALVHHFADASESGEEDGQSRCSLDYTQQSLKTPSILTPEASKVIERALESTNNETPTPTVRFRHWTGIVREGLSRTWEYATDATAAALPGLLFAVVFGLLSSLLRPPTVEFTRPAETVATSAITATTRPIVLYTKQTTSTATAAHDTVSVKGMGLISIKDQAANEWPFGPKRPDIQFSPLGHGAIMVHVASHVQKTWLKKKTCLSITATRIGEAVEMEFYPSEDGFLVKFPKKEAFGVVKVLVEATCRPAVTKAVKVHFGKGIIEEAYERTRNLAHDISELVPVAAQEAERCLVGAKKSFGAVSDTLASGMVTVSDTLMGRIETSSVKMKELLSHLPSVSTGYAAEVVNRVPQTLESMYKLAMEAGASHNIKLNVQDGILDAQLYFLRTRISARMWWLKVTGQIAEYDEYGKKAKDFMAKRRREGRNKIQGLFRDDGGKDHAFCGRTKRNWCKLNYRKGRDICLCKVEA